MKTDKSRHAIIISAREFFGMRFGCGRMAYIAFGDLSLCSFYEHAAATLPIQASYFNY